MTSADRLLGEVLAPSMRGGDAPVATGLKLHDYQEVAVEFLRGRRRAGLFLDMGLGKTAIALSALTPEMLPVLVTAPKRVAQTVWPEEVPKWRPDLSVEVIRGDRLGREGRLAHSNADIIVVTRDLMEEVVPHRNRFRTFIIDELSGFKTRSSKRWKAAKKIASAPAVEQVWGLTGTPSPNGLLDLWAQIYLLDGGERLGTSITQYRSRYFYAAGRLPTGVPINWTPYDESPAAIFRKLDDLCLSMDTEGRVELPPTTYNHITVPLNRNVMKTYRTMQKEYATSVKDIFGYEAGMFSAVNAAVLSSRLSQIAAGFMYHDPEAYDPETYAGYTIRPYTKIHTEKIAALREIVEGTGSPILVFYRYRAEAEMLKAAFPEASTIDDRDVVARWNRGEVPILLAHPASAGHGLNLQHGGHTIVWTSPTWSLEEYRQGNKRLARQGQKHPITIHHLLGEGTIDFSVLRRLEGKATVEDALLNHLLSPI